MQRAAVLWCGCVALVALGLVGVAAAGPTVTRVATGLENPRGIAVMPDGRLLVIEAGTGTGYESIDPFDDTGKLSILEDLNGDGDYDDEGEITRIFSHLPNYNSLTTFGTGRDEVGGAGDIVLLEDGRAFFTLDEPFEEIAIVEVSAEGRNVGNLMRGLGTLNAIVYDAEAEVLYVVESGLNRLSAVTLEGEMRVITSFPPLAHGQQAVPAGIALDRRTGEVLVALFSGQLFDYYGETISFMPGDAKVVRVDPASGGQTDEIVGLTTAVDVAIDEAGNVFVVEMTTRWPTAMMPRRFPLHDPDAPPDAGGYARFTGRVTMYPADGGEPVVLADGLDCPTNITYAEGALYVSTGQGTPGRPIIGPDGVTRIVGEIYRITDYLPDAHSPTPSRAN